MSSDEAEDGGLTAMENKAKWYGDAQDYWKNTSATVDGMLGGFSAISPIEIASSAKFLKELLNPPEKRRKTPTTRPRPQADVALDCGAGIGRVTKHLLIPLFETVDMVEQNPVFLEQAKEYLGEKRSRVGHFFPVGLQEFDPEPQRYDVIWCQWVMPYLTEEDFVSFMNRCKKGLKKGGIICIKENISQQKHVFDAADSSVTRSHRHFVQLFRKAHLHLIKQETQKNLPSELYKVNMYALVPKEDTDNPSNT